MTYWACTVLMKMPPTKRLQTAIEFAGENGLSTHRVYVHPEDAAGMTPPLGTHLVIDPRTPRGQFRFERGV
jgi:hypothetical protein